MNHNGHDLPLSERAQNQELHGSHYSRPFQRNFHIDQLDKTYGPGFKDQAIQAMRNIFSENLPRRNMYFSIDKSTTPHTLYGTTRVSTTESSAFRNIDLQLYRQKNVASSSISHTRKLFDLPTPQTNE